MPVQDHTYKKVFLNALEAGKNKIGLSFCNAMLKIAMKDIQLTAYQVEAMSERVDAVFKNFNLAVKDFIKVPEQQNLKVDALFCADMNDARREERLTKEIGNAVKRPAYILGEMQVSKQDFGKRLMSYVCKVFGGSGISLSKDIIPPPVYATGFCMWECDELTKGPIRVGSYDLDVNPDEKKLTEITCCNVFLGNCEKTLENRAAIDEKLTTVQSTLKEKVVKFFKGDQWNNHGNNSQEARFTTLNTAEKKVYLWLEFLAFAHLMTETQKNESLGCLGDNNVADKEVFNAAYEAIKFNFKEKSMENIKIEYPVLWGAEEAKVEAKAAKVEAEEAKQTATNLIVSIINASVDNFKSSVETYVKSVAADLRDEVCQALESRDVDASALAAFRREIEKQKSEPNTSSSSSSSGG
jgi:hypothetical protein